MVLLNGGKSELGVSGLYEQTMQINVLELEAWKLALLSLCKDHHNVHVRVNIYIIQPVCPISTNTVVTNQNWTNRLETFGSGVLTRIPFLVQLISP